MDESNPSEQEKASAQRRWEGVIRVEKSRTGSGRTRARVQQLVAESLEDPGSREAPRVPSPEQIRGRRWQPEPADWTATVFGAELTHSSDCPLGDESAALAETAQAPVVRPADESGHEHVETEAAALEPHVHEPDLLETVEAAPVAQVDEVAAPGAFEGEAPAPAVEPVAVEPVGFEVAAAEPEPSEVETDWVQLLPAEPPAAHLPSSESVPEEWVDEGAAVESAVAGYLIGSAVVFDPDVETEDWADPNSGALYIETPVIVPPRKEWQRNHEPHNQPRVPGSRRSSELIDPSRSIGATLAAARLSAGLTHDQLARITRIGVARLVEFENDDYSGCGAEVFVRGRLDSIARAVGVDPEPLLEEFDARHGQGRLVAAAAGSGRLHIDAPRNWTMVLLCALAVVAVYPVALLIVAVLG